MSDTGTRGRRVAINFSLACFEKPGEDWSDIYLELVFTILVRLHYHRLEPRSFDFLTVWTQTWWWVLWPWGEHSSPERPLISSHWPPFPSMAWQGKSQVLHVLRSQFHMVLLQARNRFWHYPTRSLESQPTSLVGMEIITVRWTVALWQSCLLWYIEITHSNILKDVSQSENHHATPAAQAARNFSLPRTLGMMRWVHPLR